MATPTTLFENLTALEIKFHIPIKSSFQLPMYEGLQNVSVEF